VRYLVVAAAVLAAACGGKRVSPTSPTPPQPALIALLPDPDTGVTGKIRVSNEFGGLPIDAPRASTTVIATAAPGALKTMSEDEVKRVFGAALDALPPAAKHFTLYFKFESDTLTDDSARQIPEVLEAVKRLPVPEVVVIGHTDTMGDAKANVALGMKRAMAVRNVLVVAGIAQPMIQVASHGEADLLIKTRDNTPEPRNRRVEISVR
jgi:outer membrane protein OmpA-like peptidoglycan-associated protein